MSQPALPIAPPPSSRELVYDDGEPMESARHVQQMTLLIDSLHYGLREREDMYVAGNMFLYFSEEQTRRNDFRGPDVFVVLDTTRHERRAWVVWEEGGKAPDVIIELLSESTEHVDRGEKMRIYAQRLHVGEYFLFDPFSGVLEGYDLDVHRRRYVPKTPDDLGRFSCVQLGLLLGKLPSTQRDIHAEWLRWIRPNGDVLPTTAEAATAEMERADAATERADAATERADAATERADAATERADAEKARADRLAAELAALKAGREQ